MHQVDALRFQSLTWVERLSDLQIARRSVYLQPLFQSLTWVERLSDPTSPGQAR